MSMTGKYTLLDDLNPALCFELSRLTGKALEELDEVEQATFLFYVGKRKEDRKFTWAMAIVHSLREIQTYVAENWDLEDTTDVDSADSDDDSADAEGNGESPSAPPTG